MNPRLERIKRAAGTPLVLSIAGTMLDTLEERFLREAAPTGIIFFRRNIESLPQLTGLTANLAKIDSMRIFAIDEEGGRVRRLPQGDWTLPPAAAQAQMEEQQLYDKARFLGRTLRQAGITMNMAPNVDLRSGEDNSIVGDRSFGLDPVLVAQKARVFIQAMHDEGVFAVLKHFPGHGTTTIDSHKSLPRIDKPLRSLREEDMMPYRLLAREVSFIMAAHLLHSEVSELPASLSPEWHREFRALAGGSCITMTDDIEMHALDTYGVEEKTRLFLASGHDLMLVCSGKPEVLHAHWEALLRILERDSYLVDRMERLQRSLDQAFFKRADVLKKL